MFNTKPEGWLFKLPAVFFSVPDYSQLQVIGEVTETISLAHHCRPHGVKPRLYDIGRVHEAINSPATQQRLREGRLLGYYTHRLRKLYEHYLAPLDGNMPPAFFDVRNGRLHAAPVYPVSRTVDLTVHKRTLTHTTQILDTPDGRQVLKLVEGSVGGWSWTASGAYESVNSDEILLMRGFLGFDYVYKPHFIPESRRKPLGLNYTSTLVGRPPAVA